MLRGILSFLCTTAILLIFNINLGWSAESTEYRHRLEIGHAVPVCVWGPHYESTCGFGGPDLHAAYLYQLKPRIGLGAFVNVGAVIAVDMGLKWRVLLFKDLLYFDLDATVMAPRGISSDHVWFFGFETVFGINAPPKKRCRFLFELQALFLFNNYGYLGFLRPFVGLAVTL